MNYELIVLDLDGTLTNGKKVITPITKEALLKLQCMGKRVALASGRPTGGVTKLADELRLDEYNGYILPFNGGRIINYTDGKLVSNQTVLPEFIPKIYEAAVRFQLAVLTYTDSEIIVGNGHNRYVDLEGEINQMPLRVVEDFVSFIDFPVNKFLMTGEPEVIAQTEQCLKEEFKGNLTVFRSEPFFLEIMPQGIDKAYSVNQLATSLGISMEQVICCGDGYNDLSMIKAAGLGVAMSNAQPEVKAAADYITTSNEEDGVAKVVYEFMLV